jgi:MFS family permease
MKNWFGFLFSNKRVLNFGFLFNFFSSFGQTFFISLFVPFWVESIKISNTAFGSLYASVTIVAAVLLSQSGGYIDKMPLKKYGWIVFSGLIVSVIVLSQANNFVWLAIGLLLVRWFGQGLMTHTSSTGIAKHFESNRGKALGITSLGHPAGQFVLPLLIVPLIAFSGWRASLLYTALAAVLVMVPSLWAIKSSEGIVPDAASEIQPIDTKNNNYLKTIKFWIIAVNIFTIPFICTAVFLYQYTIGQSKGWDIAWVTFSFAFYAIFSAIALLLSGSLVDRYSGRLLFPLYLFPAIVALTLMYFTDYKWVGPLFYALLGISAGLGSTIKTALQVEIYGAENLGKIRSYFSTILVVSTAFGAPVFGYFIDHDFSFNTIMGIAALFVIVASVASLTLWNKNQLPKKLMI